MNQVDKEKWRRLVPILIVGALLIGGYEVLSNKSPPPVLSEPQPPPSGSAAKLGDVDPRLLAEAAAGLDAKMHEVAAWCEAHPGADGPSPLWHCDPLMIVTSFNMQLQWCDAHPGQKTELCDIARRELLRGAK
jgi:hypothetical protein